MQLKKSITEQENPNLRLGALISSVQTEQEDKAIATDLVSGISTVT